MNGGNVDRLAAAPCAVWARATTAPVAGRAEPARGFPLRPTPPRILHVSPTVPATPWSFELVWRERTTATRSAIRATCGNNSATRTPGTFVGIDANGPRNSDGASGFGSQVSRCEGPP